MSRFEIKIVAALLLIAILPLVASVVLIGQVIRVSGSVASGQAERLARPLEQAADAYRRLFASLKRSFRLEGTLLAADPALRASVEAEDRPRIAARLEELRAERRSWLASVEVLGPGGGALARAGEPRGAPHGGATRQLHLSFPLGARGATLSLVFLTERRPFDDFQSLGTAERTGRQLDRLKDELATYYRAAFLVIFGAVLIAATGAGLFIARRTTRRVSILAGATRRVAEGDLDTRVVLRSRDEIGDLAGAFNEMVGQLKESRERIAYLERVGAWQDIARRLAHEIKNPLTPIQLAVQQIHRKYAGGDPEFTKMLEEATEIVTEEVEGLRRLVQAFSAFAKLPTVKTDPVDINELVDDFMKSQREIQERGRVTYAPLSPSCTVLVDKMLMRHVLFNLVENAVHAAEGAGLVERLRVRLSARIEHPRHRAVLIVEDNGPGMDEETERRAFSPYFTTKEKGTGLGLAIVKKIVLEHGGTVSMETKLGEGTRFVLTLPLA
jgi:two-component system, NtrC family, nitrogen regulation sensor histidine kinase NtrY